MKNVLVVVTLFFALVFAACAKKAAPTSTAAAEPAKPAKPKASTYTADLMPLIQMKCAPCHLPSKGGNKASFETFAGAQKFGAAMVSRIEMEPGQRGFMPFRAPAKLSAEEIAVFKKWVADGMLEN